MRLEPIDWREVIGGIILLGMTMLFLYVVINGVG